MAVPRRSLAQRKAELRRAHAENRWVHRAIAIRKSSWSTPELLLQASMETGGKYRGLRQLVELAPDQDTLRKWLAWRLADWRSAVGTPDPEHPKDIDPEAIKPLTLADLRSTVSSTSQDARGK